MRHRCQPVTPGGLAVAAILVITLLACAFNPNQSSPSSDFYVSVKGSDSAGDGSQAKPWRHVQYAVDHAQPAAGATLVIHLLKGIYQENLIIKRGGVNIVGAGVGLASTYPDDPLTPVQEVSIIVRDLTKDAPGILIQDATDAFVTLQNLVVFYGGLRAVNSRLQLKNVEVQQCLGLYGVQILNGVTFTLDHVTVTTGLTHSDYGIDIEGTDGHAGSGGDILSSSVGDLFDHAINIAPFGPGQVQNFFAPYQHPLSVKIWDSQIAGSSIYYADGVRIQGAANVDIRNTTITRTHPDNEAANTGASHNPPYAAVEMAGYVTKANTEGVSLIQVALDGVTTSGFDVGVGIAVEGTYVLVHDQATWSGMVRCDSWEQSK
jgi:polygalacturonase